jgi:hypothetical protein
MAAFNGARKRKEEQTALQERASGIIKFLAGSCLSGLGIVLKEP